MNDPPSQTHTHVDSDAFGAGGRGANCRPVTMKDNWQHGFSLLGCFPADNRANFSGDNRDVGPKSNIAIIEMAAESTKRPREERYYRKGQYLEYRLPIHILCMYLFM